MLGVDKSQKAIEMVREFRERMGCVGASHTYKEATLGEMLRAPKMMEKCARADLITMTGACGPFGNLRGKHANKGKHGMNDEQSVCYTDFLDLVEWLVHLPAKTKPTTILMENVTQLKLSKHGGRQMLARFYNLGLHGEMHVEVGTENGVPQQRERLVVFATSDEGVARAYKAAAQAQQWSRPEMPPFHTLLDNPPVPSHYFVDPHIVHKYQGVGLGAVQLVDRECEGPLQTLISSYCLTADPANNPKRKSIPYGIYVVEGAGKVRMLTENEGGRYTGLSEWEVECCPKGRHTMQALGASLVVGLAEKHVHLAVRSLGFGGRTLEKPGQHWVPNSIVAAEHDTLWVQGKQDSLRGVAIMKNQRRGQTRRRHQADTMVHSTR